MFLTYGSTIIYKYAASEVGTLDLRPNDFLVDHAIRLAIEQSFEQLDFGTSRVVETGLRRFKHKWGAVELPMVNDCLKGHIAPDEGDSRAMTWARAVIRKSPSSVCRTVGALFVPVQHLSDPSGVMRHSNCQKVKNRVTPQPVRISTNRVGGVLPAMAGTRRTPGEIVLEISRYYSARPWIPLSIRHWLQRRNPAPSPPTGTCRLSSSQGWWSGCVNGPSPSRWCIPGPTGHSSRWCSRTTSRRRRGWTAYRTLRVWKKSLDFARPGILCPSGTMSIPAWSAI